MNTSRLDGLIRHLGWAVLIAGTLSACGGGHGAGEDDAPRSTSMAVAIADPGTVIVRDPVRPVAQPALTVPPIATVAYSRPSGLIASTGNLYWTSTSVNEFGPDVSTVWRASKSNVPGQEIALYQESGDDRNFGDIVYANVGNWYGYFVANYLTPSGLVSQIKRVPLTGGAAVVIATAPSPGARDLHTDGTTLYWVDGGGIRSVPIGGGAVKTLYASAFVARISLAKDHVYYGQDYLIMRIPKAGGSSQFFASTNGRVSALKAETGAQWIFWGDKDGGVYGMPERLGEWARTYQSPTAGRVVNSVGFANGEIWSDCVQPGNTNCRIRWINNTADPPHDLVTGFVGIGHLQWDLVTNIPPRLYWGDVSYLRRMGG